MALQLPLIETRKHFSGQLSIDKAYWKINLISGNKDGIMIFIEAYDSKGGQTLLSKQYPFTPSLEGDNFIKQAYQFLKTLPEFSDAVDC